MSIKSMGLGVTAAVLAASLIACGQGQQGATPNGGAAPQPVASTANAAGVTLMVQPASVDGCNPSQPIIATVRWKSASPKVKIMVSGPNHAEPQLFSESGYTGSAKTGNWVVEHTQFTLIDEKNGQTLATYEVGSTPCSK